MDSQALLLIGLIGSFGVPTIIFAIYRLFFYKDTEPHRKELQELKEKHQDEKIARLEHDLDELKKKNSLKSEVIEKKHQEFELKFVELATKMIGIESGVRTIDTKLDKILELNKVSKIV